MQFNLYFFLYIENKNMPINKALDYIRQDYHDYIDNLKTFRKKLLLKKSQLTFKKKNMVNDMNKNVDENDDKKDEKINK